MCGPKRPEPPKVGIVECAREGNIEAVKQCQVIFKDLFNDFCLSFFQLLEPLCISKLIIIIILL